MLIKPSWLVSTFLVYTQLKCVLRYYILSAGVSTHLMSKSAIWFARTNKTSHLIVNRMLTYCYANLISQNCCRHRFFLRGHKETETLLCIDFSYAVPKFTWTFRNLQIWHLHAGCVSAAFAKECSKAVSSVRIQRYGRWVQLVAIGCRTGAPDCVAVGICLWVCFLPRHTSGW